MADKEDTTTTVTEVKTMWSETLLESLYVAMQKKVSDAKVLEILRDLKSKGYSRDYLIEKVEKKVGPNAADQLKRIYASGAKAGGGGGTRKAGSKKQGAGLVGKFKGMFK